MEGRAQNDAVSVKASAGDPQFVETGIAGVALNDPTSGRRFLDAAGIGTTSDDGLLHNFYSNASGVEILDLVQHPGSPRHSFSEVIIFLSDGFPLGAPKVPNEAFVSSKGIKLGLRVSEVRRLLGRPHGVTSGESGKTTYKYFCDNPGRCPSLAKYNMPTYSATAVILRGRLVSYSFGYDYP